MAETLAGPFVSFVVERLGDVLIHKGNLLRGVSSQVQQLQTELNRMKCFLKDAAARREDGDESFYNWVAEIREAAYDAEDVIDTFVVKVAFRRRTGILNILMRYSPVKDSISIYKVGLQIESIKTKISEIRTSFQNNGVIATREGESSSSRNERQRLLRQSYPHLIEDDVVGLDEDIKTIVEHLVKAERQCRMVSIWGMGGLGKTTLAKKVYKHNDIRRHFDSFAWAYISQQCNIREVLEEILIQLTSPSSEIPKQLTSPSSEIPIQLTSPSLEEREKIRREKIKTMKHGELVENIYEVQTQKKCLVVIDDIWKAEDWESLSPAFPNEKVACSKIMLTTRNKEVASYADQQHDLRHLNEAESWELFGKKALLRTNVTEFERSPKMMELGKEMVKHCGGLPLAIVVLGGLLATKHNMNEWEMVSRNISYYLNKDKGHRGVSVSDILALSYQDLPYHLKACFLYLSHLPEDHEIQAEKLVQMWMAEGIVSSSEEEETMLDVGMRHLGELAGRGMVQVQLTRFSRRIKLCRLHDLMRDLCLLKAKEENFLKVVRIKASVHQLMQADFMSSSSSSSSSLTTIRRLAIYYLGDHDVDSLERGYINLYRGHEITNDYHVRSCQFYSFGNRLESSGWEHIKSLLKVFKLLKVLDLERIIVSGAKKLTLPRAIGKLIHLRYLSVRDSYVEGLPSSIGNLRFLQTLDLRTKEELIIPRNNEVTRIPNVLWRLEQLRHLYLPFEFKLPAGTSKLRLDGLRKLETLEAFDTRYCDVRCFPKLTNLRKVVVREVAPKDLVVILKSPILNNNNSNPHFLQSSFFITVSGDFITEEEQRLLRQLLGCNRLHKLSLWGSLNLVKLPDQLFPPNLTQLTLGETKLEEDPMPTLEKLPHLRRLLLFLNSYIGKEMVCSAPTTSTAPSSSVGGYGCDGGFPQLKELLLFHVFNLEEWRVEEGAMPTLFRIELRGCYKLKEIPDGLRFITTLQEFEINGLSEALEDRVREGGEDFYKVQHVPFFTAD